MFNDTHCFIHPLQRDKFYFSQKQELPVQDYEGYPPAPQRINEEDQHAVANASPRSPLMTSQKSPRKRKRK